VALNFYIGKTSKNGKLSGASFMQKLPRLSGHTCWRHGNWESNVFTLVTHNPQHYHLNFLHKAGCTHHSPDAKPFGPISIPDNQHSGTNHVKATLIHQSLDQGSTCNNEQLISTQCKAIVHHQRIFKPTTSHTSRPHPKMINAPHEVFWCYYSVGILDGSWVLHSDTQ